MTAVTLLASLGLALASPAATGSSAQAEAAAVEARAAYQARDGARLEKAAREWVAGAPGSAEAQLSLGIALIWQDQPEQAVTPLRRRVALLDDADARGWLGLALRDSGDFKAGEAELRASLATAPGSSLVQGWLSTALSFQGRYREALEVARTALALTPDRPDAQEAVGHYGAASTWAFPAEALAHHGKGRWLVGLRRWKDAIAEFEAALALAPGFADCQYHTGWAYQQLGDRAGAERRWRRALADYKPGERILLTAATYNLGHSLGLLGAPEDRKEAVALLRAALAEAESWQVAPYAFALGQVCEAAEDMACTREAFLRYASAPPSLRSRDFPADQAQELARQTLGSLGCVPRPGEPDRYDPTLCSSLEAARLFQAGLGHAAQERVDQALTEFSAAVKETPRFSLAHLSLGDALMSKDRYAEAETELRAALDAKGLGLPLRLERTAKQLLASALVKQAKSPIEAVRLGLAAREGTNGDPANRAWIDVTLGRAFAQAGNPRCAAERFSWAAATKEATDVVKARARELLEMVPESSRATADRCFEYEKYLEDDLPALAAKIISTSGEAYAPDKFRLVSVETYRVRVRSMGRRRPLSESARFVATKWAEHLAKDPDHPIAQLYRTEVLVSAGGKDWWLPIQEPLLESWDQEVKPGSEVELFLWFPGGVSRQLVFMVAEFRACQ